MKISADTIRKYVESRFSSPRIGYRRELMLRCRIEHFVGAEGSAVLQHPAQNGADRQSETFVRDLSES